MVATMAAVSSPSLWLMAGSGRSRKDGVIHDSKKGEGTA
jgi:hypothetical protein